MTRIDRHLPQNAHYKERRKSRNISKSVKYDNRNHWAKTETKYNNGLLVIWKKTEEILYRIDKLRSLSNCNFLLLIMLHIVLS